MLSVSKSQHGIQKIEVACVPVNSVGVISSCGVIYIILPGQTFLVTLMFANNGSGALQHVAKVDAHFWEL